MKARLFVLSLFMGFASNARSGIYITVGTERSTHSYVNFYIEDESGRRTGRLASGTEVADIPGTRGRYGTDSMDDLVANQAGPEAVGFHTSSFPSGRFNLVLIPLATTPYWMNFSVVNDNKSPIDRVFNGFAVAGSSITFIFDHQPAADTPPLILKVVTATSLRQSVQGAFQAKQLGAAAFALRLDKLVAKAQADIVSRKNKQAADWLDQFTHRLDSAFKKEPDPDGDDDKKSASTMSRFVTKAAHDSLIEDARILIVGLGEQPKK